MGTRNRRIGRVVAGAGVGLMMLALAGCGDSREPSHLPTPAVVWPDGPPTGPYEDTEWVKAYRAEALASAVARNSMDFSDKTYVELTGYDVADKRADNYESTRERYFASGDESLLPSLVDLTPGDSLILDLMPVDDESVVLAECLRRPDDGFQEVFAVRVESRGDGKYWVTVVPGGDFPPGSKSREDYQAECEAATIPRGFFDPVPEPNLDRDAKVIGPADESKYDLD